MERGYRLERVQLIRRPRSEVFAFFSNPINLESITPGFLKFKITSPQPIEFRPGALIDYQLQLYGVKFNWQTRIEEVEPEVRFRDVQLRGPYRQWNHLHEFYEVPEGTLCVDVVDYELPLGVLGRAVHAVIVRNSLAQIFDYRREQIRRLLPDLPPGRPLESDAVAQSSSARPSRLS